MLLAKSTHPSRQDKTLGAHTRDVVDAAQALFGSLGEPTHLGRCWLSFFRVPMRDWTTFHQHLLGSCWLHDWGKANNRMQSILRREPNAQGQLFRHEHISVLSMEFPGIQQWLGQRSDLDWRLVQSVVGSHHLKFRDEDFLPFQSNQFVQLAFEDDHFKDELFEGTAEALGLSGTPALPHAMWGFLDHPAVFDPTQLRNRVRDHMLRMKPTAMLNAVRSALICSDAVGSALPRVEGKIGDWIAERFQKEKLIDLISIQELIASRTSRIDGFNWNTFQDDCGKLPSRALLLAPCGSGKTLAAWRWIQAQIEIRPVSRVLFLYPTRATATEGFKDYVSWAPEADASLMHGTASYDLNGMFPPTDDRRDKDFENTDPRLFALKNWSKRIFSATVDQFFGFLSYSYGPMCLLPLLADSVIVVDEVHSFDAKMFSGLLGFLKAFEVPVLCMTASIQSGRKEQLSELVDEVYEDRPDDLQTIANAERYIVHSMDESEVEAQIRNAIDQGKRVLWVVNQVRRAQEAVTRLSDLSVPVICYHSRFKLNDRVERHRETVAAIRPGMPPAVVVSTQVCEMSLDIDADVLITEICPITSLIQRMGRCRRGRDELKNKGPGQVLVYEPKEEHVYAQDDLEGVTAFLESLQAKPVSQSDLEEGLKRFGASGADAPSINSFLRSGGFAHSHSDDFREIEEFNLQAVLDRDIEAYLSADPKEQPGFIVPVPRKLKPETDTCLPPYLRVGRSDHYSKKTGYHDEPLVGE